MKIKKIISCIIAAVFLAGCAKIMPDNNSDNSEDYEAEQSFEESGFSSDSESSEINSNPDNSVPEQQPNPVSEPEYGEFFKKPYVHSLNLEMTQEQWNDILKHRLDRTYRSVDLTIDGMRFENAAVRTRGNSSLTSASAIATTRVPLKIKFDKYIEDRTFFGLDELILLNSADDRAYLRDYLGYEAFRAIDGKAPACL